MEELRVDEFLRSRKQRQLFWGAKHDLVEFIVQRYGLGVTHTIAENFAAMRRHFAENATTQWEILAACEAAGGDIRRARRILMDQLLSRWVACRVEGLKACLRRREVRVRPWSQFFSGFACLRYLPHWSWIQAVMQGREANEPWDHSHHAAWATTVRDYAANYAVLWALLVGLWAGLWVSRQPGLLLWPLLSLGWLCGCLFHHRFYVLFGPSSIQMKPNRIEALLMVSVPFFVLFKLIKLLCFDYGSYGNFWTRIICPRTDEFLLINLVYVTAGLFHGYFIVQAQCLLERQEHEHEE